MVYLLFAAVECAVQAAKQGGTAYQIMWFSIIVTYGGDFKAPIMWWFVGPDVSATQSTACLASWLLTRGTCSPAFYLTCYYLQPISTFSICKWSVVAAPENILIIYVSYAFANLDDVRSVINESNLSLPAKNISVRSHGARKGKTQMRLIWVLLSKTRNRVWTLR
jgi:hypothetical protein